ncbi:MAG: alanine dehydrogenase [Flavobacteriales bacterium]|jgi:alanine dehydrogenase|nr:alanine dehydrogenase [Flavobacteriales bacterium]MBT6013518.1 alanine dehydrogenase [Flavobacteriales bacterium]
MKKGNVYGSFGILPKEEMLEVKQNFQRLNIGIPKESSFQENRIAITPSAVSLLTHNGHKIIIESEAGNQANFSDEEYSKSGAKIVFSKEEVYQSDIIVKIEPPTKSELKLLKKGQQLISAIQLKTRDKEYFDTLLKKNITSLAIEKIKDKEGKLSLLRCMGEIAGTTSLLIASEYLSNVNEGKGLLLGSITGVSPTDIVIIGAGTVGEFAARTAIGLGANVRVFDNSLSRLRRLQQSLNQRISTSTIQPKSLRKALMRADVAIGALRTGEGRTPCVVSDEMVEGMKEGSVIIDVSIDHGGCFETSEVTSHKSPTFIKHDVIHYCVPNIPSRVARTSSIAICNIISPILLQIGEEGGLDNLIKQDRGVRSGVYTFKSMMTNKTLSNLFHFPYKDLDLIITAI